MTPQDSQAFEQLLANCANEPIRSPGAIQPHGVLLTLDEPGLRIRQVSANVETLLGQCAEQVVEQPLDSLLGTEHTQSIRQLLQLQHLLDAPPLYLGSMAGASKPCCTDTRTY